VPPPFAPGNRALGAAVKRVREQRGLTQRRVVEGTTLNVSYLSGIECGHRNPTWDVIARICAALEVHVSDLVRVAEAIDAAEGTADAPPRARAVEG
jgi:transcriptional regulator with XRE-family HTH domain